MFVLLISYTKNKKIPIVFAGLLIKFQRNILGMA